MGFVAVLAILLAGAFIASRLRGRIVVSNLTISIVSIVLLVLVYLILAKLVLPALWPAADVISTLLLTIVIVGLLSRGVFRWPGM
ncbi:MAG: hypothetical protein U0822_08840 [Anaerolineae bacterium]